MRARDLERSYGDRVVLVDTPEALGRAAADMALSRHLAIDCIGQLDSKVDRQPLVWIDAEGVARADVAPPLPTRRPRLCTRSRSQRPAATSGSWTSRSWAGGSSTRGSCECWWHPDQPVLPLPP